MALGLFEMRDQAGATLQQAADWLRVSTAHLWNCEQGRAKLTAEQDAGLRAFYLARIKERMERLAAAITADADVSSNQDRGAS
jgi:hypothetical protein